MAAPMRDSSLDSSGHRGKVVDAARTTTAKTVDAASTNFEYDDNEWDIGIGDLIIDLDADIEKTNENIINNNNNNTTTVTSLLATGSPQLIGGQNNMASTGANSSTSNSSVGGKTTSGKMAIEHSATVDKGLKMKIKRTKPGTKTSEAKHEIVKSNELNGNAELGVNSNSTSSTNSSSSSSNSGGGNSSGSSTNNSGGGNGGNNSSNSGNDKSNSNSSKSNSTSSSSSSNSSGPVTNSGSNSSLVVNSANSNSANVAKRGSSSHRRDKTNRDKHGGSSSQNSSTNDSKQQPSPKPVNIGNNSSSSSSSSNNSSGTNNSASNCSVNSGNTVTSNSGGSNSSSGGSSTSSSLDVVNGLVRTSNSVTSSSQQQQSATSRSVFPASTGPGPPGGANTNNSSSLSGVVNVGGSQSTTSTSSTSSSSPSSITGSSAVTQIKTEQTKVATVVAMPSNVGSQSASGMLDDRSVSPPPSKKIKTSTDPKDMVDVCVGTSVGTITEPDCLGPCEPGTSVTLEGIVWHETEGGVLVVNVTWRGKTYVGTLLDCTRHDWAPPRFCDSPTSDLDARTPKGRGKRGRAAAAATTPGNDLSNFTETRSSVHSKLRNGGAKGRRGAASSGNGNSSNSGSNSNTGTSSPTPFIPPRPEPSNKRKSRSGDDDPPTPAGKKSKVPSTVPASPVNTGSGSPPASPVLLECPEPNCSKKYKHINGLKYHQSHAHGSSAEDDDTKDITSMSENDESNIEAPSPAATPVKSPEKVSIETTPASTPQKKDEPVSVPSNVTNVVNTDPVSQPNTPKSRPQSPQTPNILQPPPEIIPNIVPPVIDTKNNVVVKPGVLRFGPQEDGNSFSTFASKSIPPTPNSTPTSNNALSTIRTQIPPSTPEQPGLQQTQQPPTPQSLYQSQQPSPLQPGHPGQPSPHQNLPPFNMPPNQQQPNPMQSPNHQKLPQFKVKPTAALMPSEEKKGGERSSNNQNKPPGYKKKSRNKSPAGSPHPQPTEVPQQFTDSSGGREDVQSPAYSDISDDTAPPTVTVLDNDVVSDKNKTDKKTENNSNGGAPPQSMPTAHTMPPQYGMYPFYGQSPYMVPSVQQPQQPQPGGPVVTNSDKGPNKLDGNPEKNPTSDIPQQSKEKDPQAAAKKDIQPEFPPQKVLPPHYYPQYGYMQGYSYNIESPYGPVPMQVPPSQVEEPKIKEERHKESPSPADQHNKPPTSLPQPIPNPIQVPTPTAKVKNEPKEKQHQNENHQILKESIEMKNQMSSPYMYSRQQPPPGHQSAQPNHNHHIQQHHQQSVAHAHAHAQQQQTAHLQQQQQRDEEMRRYYLYPDQQRRKEALEQQQAQQQAQQAQQQQQQQQQPPPPPQKTSGTPKAQPSPGGLKSHNKDKQQMDEKKEKEIIKQEGVKPTMETQGPPPPPTSQYAYIHPSYMQSPAGHYSAIPFDPNHPMYRSMLMHSPYAGNPYMHHPQIPRYHAPEDLSRGPPPGPPTKALDILQHHANQYYTSHKIHELQERALKSPTPKTSVASSSPSANVGSGGALSQSQQIGAGGPPPSGPGGVSIPGGPPGGGPQSCGPPGGPQPPPGSGNGGKQVPGDGKDSRSPPPQRHVHTHHHTHVGLGYPILAGQYPATYGAAAVLASQQAAAVTVINPYPPK